MGYCFRLAAAFLAERERDAAERLAANAQGRGLAVPDPGVAVGTGSGSGTCVGFGDGVGNAVGDGIGVGDGDSAGCSERSLLSSTLARENELIPTKPPKESITIMIPALVFILCLLPQ
jgi:hypothetical protein